MVSLVLRCDNARCFRRGIPCGVVNSWSAEPSWQPVASKVQPVGSRPAQMFKGNRPPSPPTSTSLVRLRLATSPRAAPHGHDPTPSTRLATGGEPNRCDTGRRDRSEPGRRGKRVAARSRRAESLGRRRDRPAADRRIPLCGAHRALRCEPTILRPPAWERRDHRWCRQQGIPVRSGAACRQGSPR